MLIVCARGDGTRRSPRRACRWRRARGHANNRPIAIDSGGRYTIVAGLSQRHSDAVQKIEDAMQLLYKLLVGESGSCCLNPKGKEDL